MKLAVFGSSSYNDPTQLRSILYKNKVTINVIITCNDSGASKISHAFCEEVGIPLLIYYPNYHDENGIIDKGASMRARYRAIQKSDMILILMEVGGSKGAQKILQTAIELKKKVKVIYFNKPKKTD